MPPALGVSWTDERSCHFSEGAKTASSPVLLPTVMVTGVRSCEAPRIRLPGFVYLERWGRIPQPISTGPAQIAQSGYCPPYIVGRY